MSYRDRNSCALRVHNWQLLRWTLRWIGWGICHESPRQDVSDMLLAMTGQYFPLVSTLAVLSFATTAGGSEWHNSTSFWNVLLAPFS